MDKTSVLLSALNVEKPKYTDHSPFAKQLGFLILPHKEALYGGALGGGKSDALLMAALQYVHIPGYAALLLRKTLTDLKQAGALLNRMQKWLMPHLASKEVKYKASEHTFYFPTYDSEGNRQTDSTIQFGYIGDSNAFTRYQGIELQFCGFDEVTQHAQTDYEYLFTRLRKCVCPIHTERDANENPVYHSDCELCNWAKSVPIRMRSTCNPDGVGFLWVKKRFEIGPDQPLEDAEAKGEKVKWIGHNKSRPFLPASYKDNPYLDHKAYEENLREQLSPDLYEALVAGSWGVVANARFKKRWIRYYCIEGRHLYLGARHVGKLIDLKEDIQEVFMTMDIAATSMEGPGDVELFAGRVKSPSWTVICTWALTTCYNLVWLNMIRFREEIPEVVRQLQIQYEQWKPGVALVESNGVGKGVVQYASSMGMNIKGIHKSNDKVENATQAIVQMEKGRIWIPSGNPVWLEDATEEIFTWQGHPQETDDIIDALSHAANYVQWEKAANPIDYYEQVEMFTDMDIPQTYMPVNRFRV